MRKALKILSFLAIIGGIDLIVTLVVLFTGADPKPEILQMAMMVVCALLLLVLGAQGIGAANRPSKAAGVLPISIVALLASAANVVLAIMGGIAVVSVVVCAIIAVLYAYFASQVNKEALK